MYGKTAKAVRPCVKDLIKIYNKVCRQANELLVSGNVGPLYVALAELEKSDDDLRDLDKAHEAWLTWSILRKYVDLDELKCLSCCSDELCLTIEKHIESYKKDGFLLIDNIFSEMVVNMFDLNSENADKFKVSFAEKLKDVVDDDKRYDFVLQMFDNGLINVTNPNVKFNKTWFLHQPQTTPAHNARVSRGQNASLRIKITNLDELNNFISAMGGNFNHE